MRLLSKLGKEYEMRIEHCLMEIFPQVVAVEPKTGEETGLELSEENIEKVLQEIPAYKVGEPSESLELVAIEEPIGRIQFTGPATAVTTTGVSVTWELREKIPSIAAVHIL
ncbi:hypothetical protein RHSIM_Rhsim11G0124900 [Rhododendron simsii]|uniref:Uncharacterized protein n=1 Tax=Rhododendron simsii TaxID=118357 RepID=A0A834G616_RHOSS|nr:hypothetical protein RHSIM_Rhsim11G0124900 [Rhododendron simsii]